MVSGTTTHTGMLVEAVAEDLAGLVCLTAVLQPVDPSGPPMAALMSFGRGVAARGDRDAVQRGAVPGAMYTVRATGQKLDGRCLYLTGAHALRPLFPSPAGAQVQRPAANASAAALADPHTQQAAA